MVTLTPRAHGPDMSKYDLSFDPALATHQLDFVVQRASYRTTKDEKFDDLYAGVEKMPISLAYHYLASDTLVQAQIDKFLSVVDGKNFDAYVCDFESTFNLMSQSFAKMAWDFCKAVVIATGKRCLIYTNKYHYIDWLVPSQATYKINWNLVDYWIAQYPSNPDPNGQPNLPTGRTTGWNMWQYTSSGGGTKYGMGRPIEGDLNVFNGTVTQMRDWLGITQPEPIEDNPTASFALTVGGVTYEAQNVELKPKA
jgi:GH25 family lysozyme M1 (1,4-beta-N-acetylmuramidase)